MNVYRTLDSQITGALVKAGQTNIYGWFIYNAAASARYVKLYNKATAPASTDTPVMVLALPAASAANILGAAESSLNMFPLGLGVRSSTGIADADNTAPTANDVVVNLFYI